METIDVKSSLKIGVLSPLRSSVLNTLRTNGASDPVPYFLREEVTAKVLSLTEKPITTNLLLGEEVDPAQVTAFAELSQQNSRLLVVSATVSDALIKAVYSASSKLTAELHRSGLTQEAFDYIDQTLPNYGVNFYALDSIKGEEGGTAFRFMDTLRERHKLGSSAVFTTSNNEALNSFLRQYARFYATEEAREKIIRKVQPFNGGWLVSEKPVLRSHKDTFVIKAKFQIERLKPLA